MHYIVRYGEIGLKGKNRSLFEKRLVRNIKDCLKKSGIKEFKIKRVRGRILIKTDKECNCLKRVFGIVSFSKAVRTGADLEKIKKAVLELIKNKKFESFRVTTKKPQKSIKLDSMESNKEIGAFIQEKTRAKVDLTDYKYNLQIELFDDSAFVFDKKTEGFGGLPRGIAGRVLCLAEKEEDLLASWLMMKRGCGVFLAGRKKINTNLLDKFDYGQKLGFLKIKNIKELEKLAKENNCKALVVSQTLEEFKNLKLDILTLRPLIGYSKEEIKNKMKEIK